GGDGGERCAVLVTHDPLDALALADTVVVVEDGRISERGPVRQVLSAPRSAFGARAAGLVLLPGRAVAGGLRTADGHEVAGAVDPACRPGEAAVAVLSPSAVAVHAAGPGGGGPGDRERWPATVVDVQPRGEVVRLRARAGDLELLADLPLAAAAELDLAPGAAVHLVLAPAAVRIHPAAGERPPFGGRP
ncbi:TOBE domain-containing protein, partial [Kineococcus sp. T13]|uniref:TOBE domain-containing protein n=1 Tax=Kineococcus vitellinus TaxID=2696565 RepID=UPI00141255A7